jgi:hypothetical protein
MWISILNTPTVQREQILQWQSLSTDGASADVESAEKWQKHVKTIVIQHAAQHILNLDETPLFYNSQMKRTLALKREKCQGGKWHEDRTMVLLCCSADDTKKICPSIISKF